MYRHWTAGDAAAAAAAAAASEIPEAFARPNSAGLTAQELQMRAAALGNLGYNTLRANNPSPYLQYAQPNSSSAALYLHQHQQAALQQQAQQQQQAVALHHAQERAKAQAAAQQQQALQQQQQQLRNKHLLKGNDVIEIDESDSDEEEEEELPQIKKGQSSKTKKNVPPSSPELSAQKAKPKDKEGSTLALKAQKAKLKEKEVSTLALKAQTAKHEEKEASAEDLQGRRKRARPPAPSEDVSNLKPMKKKQLMTVVKDSDQPVVVVQNWSREGLMEELAKNSKVHKDRMRESIFLHTTGYTKDNAPEYFSFPPKEIKLTSFQVEGLVADLVKDQLKTLQDAVDATFYKCAHYVNDMRGGAMPPGSQMILPPTPQGQLPISIAPPPGQSGNIGASIVAAKRTGGGFAEEKASLNKNLQHQQQLIKKQQDELLLLRTEVNKVADEKKRVVESFRKEEAYLKDQVTKSKTIHSRSVRAYMKASASSLQWLRERVDGSDDDDSGDEDL